MSSHVPIATEFVQVSSDVQMLVPALVAILVAKGFADALEPHSFYHAVMDAAKMPFLPPKPHTRVSLDLVRVRAVMAAPVRTVPRAAKLYEVEDLLRRTAHSGFPVIEPAGDGMACVGLVTRNVLLVRALAHACCNTRTAGSVAVSRAQCGCACGMLAPSQAQQLHRVVLAIPRPRIRG
jgi:CBS domain